MVSFMGSTIVLVAWCKTKYKVQQTLASITSSCSSLSIRTWSSDRIYLYIVFDILYFCFMPSKTLAYLGSRFRLGPNSMNPKVRLNTLGFNFSF